MSSKKCLLTKIGLDTAENEPIKGWGSSTYFPRNLAYLGITTELDVGVPPGSERQVPESRFCPVGPPALGGPVAEARLLSPEAEDVREDEVPDSG